MQLRSYQQQAIHAVYDYLRNRDGNPCIVIPTGGGKTPVMASICSDAVNMWDGRVLVLAHVKELLEQTAGTLSQMAPDLDIGIYSAGLKRREKRYPVTVAGIQSVYKRACEFDPFDLIIVDEAHMIPPSGEGMYQTFLKEAEVINPHVRLIGLTATPYRMTTGMICTPEHLLNEICFEVGVRELIAQGYLCPLRSKASRHKVDTSGLHIRGGEFIPSEVEALMDDEHMVLAACREIVELTKDRNKVLIFAAGVEHGLHIQHILEARHQKECGFICGETLPFERADVLQRFREGQLKYLCNVNVLTMGFDAPNIDCVALVRPTNSPGLYYQMIGRGFRIHPSKEECLVLDFGGNIMRHGPVDAIRISPRNNSFEGQAPVKECPNCHEVIHAGYSQCPQCEFVFESDRQVAHEKEASTENVLSGKVEVNEYEVHDVIYHYHIKRGAKPTDPPTLRVEYLLGFNHYQSEWLCFEHTGYARNKAEAWWRQRSNEPVPNTVQQAIDLAQAGALAQTEKITVRSVSGETFDRITEHKLGPKPPLLDGSEERDDGFLPQYSWAEDDIPF
ncbi:MAG: DEAD/DEAH box helicase family protein [Phycisphaerae bacterium]|nr:DEAD/DEAH box helicase family protein [Phycisphaerae bacterium]